MPKRRMRLPYPSRKRTRTMARRRAPFRRIRFRRRRQFIPRTITPDTKMIKMRYAFTAQMNPSSGATAMINVKANDLYAPSSGFQGAHQPMGFDQIMQLYERFCVVGSKISVAFESNQSSSAIVGIALRNSTTAESVQDNTAGQSNEGLLERNRTKWTYASSSKEGAPIARVSQKFGLKKFFHLKSINDNVGNSRDEGSAWGLVNASPTQLAYYNIFAAAFSDYHDIDLTVRVVVEYTAIFQGRKLLVRS